MQVLLYSNKSENNKIGKDISLLNTLEGTIREQTSIINPTIEMNANDVPLCNYAYIPSFGRYYFITNIESVRKNLWAITMKCDVLETYKQQIWNNEGVVGRQENLYNLYLRDDMLKFSSETFTLYKKFPNSHFDSDNFLLLTCG